MRLIAWEKIKANDIRRVAGHNLWDLYATSPLDMKILDFKHLEEMFMQPEKKVVEKKEEPKKQTKSYISLIDGKKSLGINLITKNLRR